jgi:hypothetical protein
MAATSLSLWGRAPRLVVVRLVLAALVLWTAEAAAQPVSDSARATARELADEGGVLYAEGRYAEALEKLDQAYGLLPVPTIGYWSARCMQELGRLVEASERYLEVASLTIPERGSELHKKARDDAAAARKALVPRIPRLRIVVRAGPGREVAVTVDGAPVSRAMFDLPLPMNPGSHEIVGRSGEERVVRRVSLLERGEIRVELPFESRSAPDIAQSPGEEPSPPKPGTAPDPSPPDASAGDASPIQIAGYALVGVGAAALAAGIATGAALLVIDENLGAECVDDECSSEVSGDVATYNALRPTTTVLLAVGGSALAAGLVMALALPPVMRDKSTSLTPVVAPDRLGVTLQTSF